MVLKLHHNGICIHSCNESVPKIVKNLFGWICIEREMLYMEQQSIWASLHLTGQAKAEKNDIYPTKRRCWYVGVVLLTFIPSLHLDYMQQKASVILIYLS